VGVASAMTEEAVQENEIVVRLCIAGDVSSYRRQHRLVKLYAVAATTASNLTTMTSSMTSPMTVRLDRDWCDWTEVINLVLVSAPPVNDPRLYALSLKVGLHCTSQCY